MVSFLSERRRILKTLYSRIRGVIVFDYDFPVSYYSEKSRVCFKNHLSAEININSQEIHFILLVFITEHSEREFNSQMVDLF